MLFLEFNTVVFQSVFVPFQLFSLPAARTVRLGPGGRPLENPQKFSKFSMVAKIITVPMVTFSKQNILDFSVCYPHPKTNFWSKNAYLSRLC